MKEDGTPAFGVVGIEEPLASETLARLYRDHADYVERFNRRLDELVAQGWFLAEDADEMRAEAEEAERALRPREGSPWVRDAYNGSAAAASATRGSTSRGSTTPAASAARAAFS